MDLCRSICGREARLQNAQGEPGGEKDAQGPRDSGSDTVRERTINVECLKGKGRKGTDQNSPFFTRLPLEIRFRIYRLVMPQGQRLWVRPASVPVESSGWKAGYLEHFPCNKPPVDTTWISTEGTRCCLGVNNSFFKQAHVLGLSPHRDSLALMRTCQQIYGSTFSRRTLSYASANRPSYVDTCSLWTFCFDDLAILRTFTEMARHLPVRHLQVMLYADRRLYGDDATDKRTTSGWLRRMNGTWERKLQELDMICREIPQLTTLLLSVHASPRFSMLEKEEAVMESLRSITAAPQVRTELLCGRPGREARQESHSSRC